LRILSQFPYRSVEKLPSACSLGLRRISVTGGGVYFNFGGSEATETAIKLRAAVSPRKRPERSATAFSPRRQSYHGSTLGAICLPFSRKTSPAARPTNAQSREWDTSLRVSAIVPFRKKNFSPNPTGLPPTIFTSIYSNTNRESRQPFIFEPVRSEPTLGAPGLRPEGFTRPHGGKSGRKKRNSPNTGESLWPAWAVTGKTFSARQANGNRADYSGEKESAD